MHFNQYFSSSTVYQGCNCKWMSYDQFSSYMLQTPNWKHYVFDLFVCLCVCVEGAFSDRLAIIFCSDACYVTCKCVPLFVLSFAFSAWLYVWSEVQTYLQPS